MNAPKAPDPVQTANTQQQYNLQAAQQQQKLNMVDQSNPYGSLKYSQTGTNPDGTPKYTATTAYSAPEQALFDAQTSNQAGAQGVANKFLTGGQGAFSGKGPDLSYDGTAASLDALNRSRLDPQWAQNTDQQESKLANQGLQPGTPAYENAMRSFNAAKNDAYNSANLMDYQSAVNSKLASYNSPLQSYTALMGQSGPASPTAGNINTPTGNVAGTNYAGLAEDNYKQELASHNAMMGGIFGTIGTLGGTALSAGMGGMGGMGGLFGGSGGAAPMGMGGIGHA